METVLECRDLEKYYGNKDTVTKAIDGISFEVKSGEYLGIMGPSGSGKTTILNCVSTIDRVSAGHIYIGGQDLTSLPSKKLSKFRREQLGFIFQDSNLLDTLTGFENIALSLTITNCSARTVKEQVNRIAKELSITEVLDKFPYQMSGGQKQRVAAARAIVSNPSLVLADEPTGALDSKSARVLLESFEVINTQMNGTILMVTHDSFAASYCKRILFVKDGKVYQELIRGDKTRREFFSDIIDVITVLGGDSADVL